VPSTLACSAQVTPKVPNGGSVLSEALSQTVLYSDGMAYSLIHLPPQATTPAAGILAEIGQPFLALIVDKDEVSLILPTRNWQALAHRLPGAEATHNLRLITLDVVLDHDLIGYLAHVSRVLAEAGIPILALSAYERDHILVPQEHFETAWTTLEALTRSATR
jgi:hypothetical protein